jgi:hypothetical protein
MSHEKYSLPYNQLRSLREHLAITEQKALELLLHIDHLGSLPRSVYLADDLDQISPIARHLWHAICQVTDDFDAELDRRELHYEDA